MKTKQYFLAIIALAGALMVSCDDYFDFENPGTTQLQDAFNLPQDAVDAVTAAYVPLTWEYGGTYYPEWWIGDICSDDALKGGGSLSDMELVYDMENFKTRSDNFVLERFYRAQYVGAFRANLVFENVATMDTAIFKGAEAGLQERLLGEAHFLRGYYYLRLARVFGGVPIIDRIIRIQNEWQQPRASEADTYEFIYSELKEAIRRLPERYASADDLGRATRGAARALLMKAYLQQGDFANARLQGDTIVASGRYSLAPDYFELFTVEGENGVESVFETQYVAEGSSDYGQGEGFTRGTFTVVMTRPRWSGGDAWGFNRPSDELYAEFEPGDLRREAAIYSPTLDQIPMTEEEKLHPDDIQNQEVYLGNRYSARKYAMMTMDTTFLQLQHPTRAPINRKDIRYADVLLMYAEACVKSPAPDLARAKWALEAVRSRARAASQAFNPAVPASVLPPFPNYSVPLRGVGMPGSRALQDNAEDLYLAIQHERRVELAMEGHRWYDLKRWGILAEVMNHYRATTRPQIAVHIDPFIKGKHELFPIPLHERDLNPMPQNPGYDGVPVQ
ncbi:MAG: RagB/SusD family nutrient uptake outer membrane protein [Dysgonamonadaceae bacterium]|jgi:hypothetical protein|nr:RagB/SusD family nutrient uptake outer membrane protein [Dysgonamonadaceae bacterium]